MAYKAAGSSYRERITLIELFEKFLNNAKATKWFESIR